MKKRVLLIFMTALIFILSACSPKRETPTRSPATVAETSAAEETSSPQTDAETHALRDRDTVYEYETREIWCENNGGRIYGVAYIPQIDGQSRFPLVIHAHGMGSNHEAGEGYCKRYAEHGFAAYTFDFPGGSRPTTENKSDGDPLQNSAVTEASDLQTVLDTALDWDFVDSDYVFLEGGSMGGLVVTMVGLDNTDTVSGLLLHYPALNMPMIVDRYGDLDQIPETISFGEDYVLGKRFVTDLVDVDVMSRISGYDRNVIIVQGSEDSLVPASTTKEMAERFPNCEYYLIDGAGHGFSGDDLALAAEYGLDYLFKNAY